MQLPVNAILLYAGIGITLDTLQFAPSYVLNALYGLGVVCVLFPMEHPSPFYWHADDKVCHEIAILASESSDPWLISCR